MSKIDRIIAQTIIKKYSFNHDGTLYNFIFDLDESQFIFICDKVDTKNVKELKEKLAKFINKQRNKGIPITI